MKKISVSNSYKLFLTFLFACMNVMVWAQDSTGSTSRTVKTTSETTTTTDWYTQPWVWVVAGAVFLIILVALLRGNSTDKKEVTRTTVIKDDRGY